MNKVILVDKNDRPIGTEEKIAAHKKALLHRAFSVFLFFQNEQGELELLLQQRHSDKYHCGGLWTNSCCSHPKPDEETVAAAKRRTQEELGIKVELTNVGNFIYKADFENGLTEHEFDHVLVGYVKNKNLSINPTEISHVEWLTITGIYKKLKDEPEKITPWFKEAFEIAIESIKKK